MVGTSGTVQCRMPVSQHHPGKSCILRREAENTSSGREGEGFIESRVVHCFWYAHVILWCSIEWVAGKIDVISYTTWPYLGHDAG